MAFYAMKFIERRERMNALQRTTISYEQNFRNYIIPFSGIRVASSLRWADSIAFVDYLLTRPRLRSPRTVIQIFYAWQVLVNYMIDEGVPLSENVTSRVTLPEVMPRSDIRLTPGQVMSVASAIRQLAPRYEIAVWLAACAGLRQGEVLGLRWENIDMDRGLVSITEQQQKGKTRPLKTRSSYATLAVDAFLVERLKEHLLRYPPSEKKPLAEFKQQESCASPSRGFILTKPTGAPLHMNNFYWRWRQAVEIAGLPAGTRFHSLKRFYTSVLGTSGHHDPKTVQHLSRHARFAQTWDVYVMAPPPAVGGRKVTDFSEAFISPE
ncbi:tyrosine-type recombinase/integrase [Streptomyces olivochromogenes]|uniref:tyrosine-type recombinase/integrase n=1 Tax=Streptomyces olivochromogenes TaxID=1963 RepID=UPI001F3E77EF|nr:site-specific integrase [Streptomyces olivochromogenes]